MMNLATTYEAFLCDDGKGSGCGRIFDGLVVDRVRGLCEGCAADLPPRGGLQMCLCDEQNKPMGDRELAAIIKWASTRPRWHALLKRLIAAEDAVHQAYRCTSDNKKYYNIWRKAAGK